MTVQLLNDAGEAVAVRFSGGARGPLADVHMPRSVFALRDVGGMMVHEEQSPGLRTTLAGWVRDMQDAGRTVRFANDLKL